MCLSTFDCLHFLQGCLHFFKNLQEFLLWRCVPVRWVLAGALHIKAPNIWLPQPPETHPDRTSILMPRRLTWPIRAQCPGGKVSLSENQRF